MPPMRCTCTSVHGWLIKFSQSSITDEPRRTCLTAARSSDFVKTRHVTGCAQDDMRLACNHSIHESGSWEWPLSWPGSSETSTANPVGSGALRVGRRCKNTPACARSRATDPRERPTISGQRGGSCQSRPNGGREIARSRPGSTVAPSCHAPAHAHTACRWQRDEKKTAVKHSSTAS